MIAKAKKKKKATTVAGELTRLRGRKKLLKPSDVVAWAQANTESALHRQFTWDTTEAAHKWNLHQARNLIRVHVTVLADDTEPVRAYVSLKADRRNNTGYRVMVDVLSDPVLRQTMLDEALQELQSFERKYRAVTELAPVFDAIHNVKAKRVT